MINQEQSHFLIALRDEIIYHQRRVKELQDQWQLYLLQNHIIGDVELAVMEVARMDAQPKASGE